MYLGNFNFSYNDELCNGFFQVPAILSPRVLGCYFFVSSNDQILRTTERSGGSYTKWWTLAKAAVVTRVVFVFVKLNPPGFPPRVKNQPSVHHDFCIKKPSEQLLLSDMNWSTAKRRGESVWISSFNLRKLWELFFIAIQSRPKFSELVPGEFWSSRLISSVSMY